MPKKRQFKAGDHPLLFERKYLKNKDEVSSRLAVYYSDPKTRVAMWYLQVRSPKLLKKVLGDALMHEWTTYFGDGLKVFADLSLRQQLPESLKKQIPHFEEEQAFVEKAINEPVSSTPDHPARFILPHKYIALLVTEEILASINELLPKINSRASEGIAAVLVKLLDYLREDITKEESTEQSGDILSNLIKISDDEDFEEDEYEEYYEYEEGEGEGEDDDEEDDEN